MRLRSVRDSRECTFCEYCERVSFANLRQFPRRDCLRFSLLFRTKYLLCWILRGKCEPSRPNPRTELEDREDRWDCLELRAQCLLSCYHSLWDWSTSDTLTQYLKQIPKDNSSFACLYYFLYTVYVDSIYLYLYEIIYIYVKIFFFYFYSRIFYNYFRLYSSKKYWKLWWIYRKTSKWLFENSEHE